MTEAQRITRLEYLVEACSRRNETDFDRIAELERQVLALRGALENCSRHAIANDMNTDRFAEMVREALTDTAQAGREAEARVLDDTCKAIESWYPLEPFGDLDEYVIAGIKEIHGFVKLRANRLRNGGSDSEPE